MHWVASQSCSSTATITVPRLTGARPQRAYYYWHYVGNRLITFIARALYNTTLSDIYTCYKAFRREQLVGLDVESDGFEFDAEFLAILLKRRLVVYEVPIGDAPAIIYPGVVLTRAAHVEAARRFIAFLQSAAARDALAASGFLASDTAAAR